MSQSNHSEMMNSSNNNNQLENIKVAVRLRPFTQREKERNNKRIVDIRDNTVVLYNLHHNDVQLKKFTFDYSYWSHDGFKRDDTGINVPDPTHPNSSRYVGQDKVFEDLGSFLLKNALEGYNSALLAYGQTGSGKSYTVSGYGQNEGILPRFARALFMELEEKVNISATAAAAAGGGEQQQQQQQLVSRYEVYFSMLEIYNEVVRDLLAKSHATDMSSFAATSSMMVRRGLKVREHPKYGFFVENLTSFPCANKDEIEQRIEEGQLNKSIAATSMNEMSSRGHTIYEFRIKQYINKHQQAATATTATTQQQESVTTSVVQLVDLAGSERMAVHHVTNTGGGDSFVGSRSNTPYPRQSQQPSTATSSTAAAPVPRQRTSKIGSAASASSSNESSNNRTSSVRQSNNKESSLPPIHGSSPASHQQRFKESVAINQSLSALGNCIQVLSQYSQQLESQQQHQQQPRKAPPKIPYRDSVLTKLLNRCCLSGNSKVVLIATLSPIDSNYDDTLSTLRFADRAKRIRTHALINKVERSEILSQLDENDDPTELSEEAAAGNLSATSSSHQRAVDAMATPTRSRRTMNRSSSQSKTKISNSRSNPSLAVKSEQMRRLVSPASRKVPTRTQQQQRSKAAANRKRQPQGEADGLAGSQSEQRQTANEDGLVDDELDDIEEGLLSSDEDEEDDDEDDGDGNDGGGSGGSATISLSAFRLDTDGSEEMTTEEKIQLFNRMLSNRSERPRRSKNHASSKAQHQQQQVPLMSSSLKKDNPYLSNLNPDEQLTGVLGYILKVGETIVGKSKDCDIILHGPELRGQHAKFNRTEDNIVHVEPILGGGGAGSDKTEQVALMVNGNPVPVGERVKLNHCDRLLFGTNAYFVFANNLSPSSTNGQQQQHDSTLADLDMVTYDMARNEVLRKFMAEGKNEAMLKEINDYTHRPGTGKHRVRSADLIKSPPPPLTQENSTNNNNNSKLLRTMTIEDQEEPIVESSNATLEGGHRTLSPQQEQEEPTTRTPVEDQEALYRERLMEDTYEYTLPVAELNAVTKEMGIKVNYGLKILTGEEQLSEQLTFDSSPPDGLSVSSGDGRGGSGGGGGGGGNGTDSEKAASAGASRSSAGHRSLYQQENQAVSSHLARLDGLDIPPALYIRVHLEEMGIDFYWSKEKFETRRFKILELYGPWDVAGKSGLVEHLIDQSRYQGDYLIDPFVDEPASTFVLIGHAQITLAPISHLSDLEESFDIIDLDDGTLGSLRIQATPCDTDPLPSSASSQAAADQQTYRVFSDSELEKCLLDNPRELLDKKLVFRLTIKSCHNVPADKFCNIFCQYQLQPELPPIRTRLLRETYLATSLSRPATTSVDSHQSSSASNNNNSGDSQGDSVGEPMMFEHSHFICFDQVNQDVLDFLEHGFLTIQVVGQYKLSAEDQHKPPTVISTIISSINKYKMRIEQQQQRAGGQFSGGDGFQNNGAAGSGAYFGSQTGSSSKSQRGPSSSGGAMNSNSASSVVSTSATVNLFDPQGDDEDGSNSINSLSQENIIDMILTKRKLDRAENQLHYLKRTINIAEHYNKKHIPLKTIKKLLNSYGHELESGSLEEFADVTAKARTSNNKSSACVIQ